MPLPLPLIGSALALVTGAVLLRERRAGDEGGGAESGETSTRRHLVVRLNNTRLTLRGVLRGLGDRKLEIWQEVLQEFAHTRQKIANLPHDTPSLRFDGLPALTEADLLRMARCGAVVSEQDAALLLSHTPEGELDQDALWARPPAARAAPKKQEWQDVLPAVSLLAVGARGQTPLDPLGPEHQDCATLAWLAADDLQPTPGPLLGGITLGEAAQAALRGEGGSPVGDRELRALLAALETTQILAAQLAEATRPLDKAARSGLTELWMLVRINDDYQSMSDLPLPTVSHAPRRIVERAHHLAAVLLRLCEAPILGPGGALRSDLQALLDVADAAVERYA